MGSLAQNRSLSRVKNMGELTPLHEGHKYPLQGQETPTPLHLKLCINSVLRTTTAETGNPAEGHPSPPRDPSSSRALSFEQRCGDQTQSSLPWWGGGAGGGLPKQTKESHPSLMVSQGELPHSRVPPSADGVLSPHTQCHTEGIPSFHTQCHEGFPPPKTERGGGGASPICSL